MLELRSVNIKRNGNHLFLFFTLLTFLQVNAFAEFDHNHNKWDNILRTYTLKREKQVYFDYKGLKKNKAVLDSYLQQLEKLSQEEFTKFSEDEKLSFWINAYNAYTIQIILKHYPVKSIREIKSGFFSIGPWKISFINLLNKKMSLDDIEHGIIRKQFAEPRIHFAVNCASIGCPSLLQNAFTAKNLEEQLNYAAKNFLTNTKKNYVNNKTLYLSKIFDWYGEDFDKKYGGYIHYIIQSLGLKSSDYVVKFNEYNWQLNEGK